MADICLFVDNLTNVDFSYLDAERGVVGETWLASVELEGTLDEQGMICDFGIVKKKLREWLDTEIDHRLLVPKQSASLTVKQSKEDSTTIDWSYGTKSLQTSSPNQAITFVDANSITEEATAQWCIKKLMGEFPETVKSLKLSFVPETIDGPFYHYSHGLKKHAGNCQRIAHGHRSKIEIWRNGSLCLKTMKHWAKLWQDIYIGTRADLSEEKTSDSHYHFSYLAQQGYFDLSIPKENCYLIDTDSTVELIAQHIATVLKNESPGDQITVKAYEGLSKGAKVGL